MREIKFRAWQKDKKIMNEVTNMHFKSEQVSLKEKENVTNTRPFADVILMQYTGLKDKNGKEIYEGDIIGYENWKDEIEIDGVVKYGEFNCSCCSGVFGWYIDNGDIRDVEIHEVIGNIWDNPELLEKEEE